MLQTSFGPFPILYKNPFFTHSQLHCPPVYLFLYLPEPEHTSIVYVSIVRLLCWDLTALCSLGPPSLKDQSVQCVSICPSSRDGSIPGAFPWVLGFNGCEGNRLSLLVCLQMIFQGATFSLNVGGELERGTA